MLPAIKRIILSCVILAIFAGCDGGAMYQYELGNLAVNKQWEAWNPLAEPVVVPATADALAQAPWRNAGAYKITALDQLNQPMPEVLAAVQATATAQGLELRLARPLQWANVVVAYDPQNEHSTGVELERRDGIGMSGMLKPGLLALCVTGLHDNALSTAEPLAVLRFATGAETVVKHATRAPQGDPTKVRDLSAVNNGDGSVTLQWSERNTGDYDLNGIVAVADVVRIGQLFGRVYTEADADYAEVEVVDGNEDTQISVADLVPIAINLNCQITGYNVYRTPLTSASEVPDVDDAGRWTFVPNTAVPTGPSAPRVYTPGTKIRLTYTFIDDSGVGDFGWYVAPTGLAADVPPEGPKSAPATLTVVQLPESGLSFEIMAPATDTVNVNDEFYLAVKVAGVTGLFSANVRFEYDAGLVQYMEGVSAYDTNVNFLVPPLFLAHDYGVQTAPYNLLGFNATETQGEPGKDGNGYLGFFKFKALAAGANASCFRFPQTTTLIYLWGTQYGIPIATPSLGPAQSLTIQ